MRLMRMARRLFPLFCLSFLLLLIVSSCGGSGGRGPVKPSLCVSVAPQKYLLDAIVGDLYDVHVLIPENADPESYDPSMRAMKDLYDSSIFFSLGNEGFEKALIAKIKANFPELRIVSATAGLPLITDTHGEESTDPHVWGSVKTVAGIARNMTEALCLADPGHAETFRRNNMKLQASLDSLDREVRAKLSHADGAFAIWHPSLSYFARDYSLRQLPLEVEGKEAAPGQFSRRLDDIRASGAKVMFIEPLHGAERAEAMAEELNLKCVKINLGALDWPAQIRLIASSLQND